MTGIGALTCFLIIVPTFRMKAGTPWPDKAFQEKIQQTQEYPWDHKEHPGA